MSIKQLVAAALVGGTALVGLGGAASAAPSDVVPGQQGRDGVVTGHYTLEQNGCDYVVNFRGDFGGDPYLDNGWIINAITCEDGGAYGYLIVHETDSRYTGNPDRAIWGSWEIIRQTESGVGNTANPMHPAYFGG